MGATPAKSGTGCLLIILISIFKFRFIIYIVAGAVTAANTQVVMNRQLMKYCLFLFIVLPGCHPKVDKKNAQTLLTLWSPDIKLEFMSDNTLHFKNAAPYHTEIPEYTLSLTEIAQRDSFTNLMLGNKNQESYIDHDNCFETREYSISINSVNANKEIRIVGHEAQQKYYDFVFWALALKKTGKPFIESSQ